MCCNTSTESLMFNVFCMKNQLRGAITENEMDTMRTNCVLLLVKCIKICLSFMYFLRKT